MLTKTLNLGLPPDEHRRFSEQICDTEELIIDLSSSREIPTPTQPPVTTNEYVKNLEIDVPAFKGDRSKYALFKKLIEIVIEQGKSKPEERFVFLS